ncbi:DUF2971 domain-containing protein [Enterobacter asburiae]|uniref:DUF2971 domain-containing protein n=3 Tax=Enterobacter TaxID=547 RepID=UPI0010CA5811|nr:DUF2971 domain-containing protein [Enterobacter asburiae]BBJ65310.1 hypothetical protein EAS1808013_p10150 [Enterobacter asburiae]
MKLYHYTDLNGLKGIIENGSLWATNLYFLNDSQELLHGMECIRKAIPFITDSLPRDYVNYIVESMNKYDLRQSKNAYNISFCLEPELLSQWRGYASSQGVCLQFESDDLLQSLNFDDCEYVSNKVIYCEKGETIQAKEQIINFFNSLKQVENEEHRMLLEPLHAAKFASTVTPFFKNDRFMEEKEFRFVLYPIKGVHEINFRVGKNGLIPYIEIKAHQGDKYRGRMPIEKVIIGPSSNSELMQNGIRMLLDQYRYRNTEVELSQTPYRG